MQNANQGLLGELIQSLRCLPGVGQKTAQRMAFHLLQRDRVGAQRLSATLLKAVNEIGYCQQCRTLSETPLCRLCSHPGRDESLLCVVENPADVWAIEQATAFGGRYFVLHGRLSPLDGIGPEQLNIPLLEKRLAEGLIREMVIATNSTVEGEATAFFLGELARRFSVTASRIAHGVPMGGELEYIDSGTLAHAFQGRRTLGD
jgi:recombination protein RecR